MRAPQNADERMASESWPLMLATPENSVDTLDLRPGFSLVLSQIGAGASGEYHLAETQDVFGVGFHLLGGARFDGDTGSVRTSARDVWVGSGPKSSVSRFSLPPTGFRTVSLRFAPSTFLNLLDDGEGEATELATLAAHAGESASMTRITSLDDVSAAMIGSIFATGLTGAARRLFLESCALHLLAAQISAGARDQVGQGGALRMRDRQRMEEARAYLDQHLAEPPSIAQLARVVGVNEFKLKRDFKQMFGATIFGHVRRRRMELAALHLREGLSVGEVSLAAGYDCRRCFSDAFRRQYGVSPSAFLTARG